MIDYISGRVADLNPTTVVVDCHGVGYEINITLLDYSSLQGQESAKLYIHEAIRDDSHLLYGFLEKECREMFRLLIGVSGVGPNTARLILSAMTLSQLTDAIATGSDLALKAVKGIGGKTAQRIIVDLRDKINSGKQPLLSSISVSSQAYDDSLSALLMLGFSAPQSRKALDKLFVQDSSMTVEEAIKQALKML